MKNQQLVLIKSSVRCEEANQQGGSGRRSLVLLIVLLTAGFKCPNMDTFRSPLGRHGDFCLLLLQELLVCSDVLESGHRN